MARWIVANALPGLAQSGQVPACQDHPGEPATARAPVMPGDDQLIASVAPLRRQDPDLRAGREMLHPAVQLQAALAVSGLLRDVRHDPEGGQLRLPVPRRHLIGTVRLARQSKHLLGSS